MPRQARFRLTIYVFKDAEVLDFAAPCGVFSVARRFDPELDVFLITECQQALHMQSGFMVISNYVFSDHPALDIFLLPGGFGTRQEIHTRNLHDYILKLPETCQVISVCTGSWIYARMGLLNGLAATN
jgi:transcriptional regulator GlxA family with amidase domain